MQRYNNRAPLRLVSNKGKDYNIYYSERGETYRNINTELIIVRPRKTISRKLYVKNKDTIKTHLITQIYVIITISPIMKIYNVTGGEIQK